MVMRRSFAIACAKQLQFLDVSDTFLSKTSNFAAGQHCTKHNTTTHTYTCITSKGKAQKKGPPVVTVNHLVAETPRYEKPSLNPSSYNSPIGRLFRVSTGRWKTLQLLKSLEVKSIYLLKARNRLHLVLCRKARTSMIPNINTICRLVDALYAAGDSDQSLAYQKKEKKKLRPVLRWTKLQPRDDSFDSYTLKANNFLCIIRKLRNTGSPHEYHFLSSLQTPVNPQQGSKSHRHYG